MRIAFVAFALLVSGSGVVRAACEDGLPERGSRDDVLIVVNDNAVDSCEVARYYAEKRQLGRDAVLHVNAPATPSIGYVEYEILRNQIIRGMQRKLQASGVQPAKCDGADTWFCPAAMAQLKSSSSIRYIVFTKGVPARVMKIHGEPWSGPNYSVGSEAGSIDGYVRGQLGNFLYPARLDGLDLAAAKRLVDRALAAERDGWYGNLISAAVKGGDGGVAPAASRFAKAGYHPATDYSNPVASETLLAQHRGDPNGRFIDKVPNGAPDESYQFWRYVFGLFDETDTACTGNSGKGFGSGFYLGNAQWGGIGKAPLKCKVRLVKGNGASPAYDEWPPGVPEGRMPVVADAVAYLGHLDGQPSLGGNFEAIKNWRKKSECTPRLCADAKDAAACRAESTDALREFDTSCIGVADGFIGHNFQSYPLSYFTSWPTGWRPLQRTTLTGAADFGAETNGGYNWPIAYARIKHDDGDGDSFSAWFGNHDRKPQAGCYRSDLSTTTPCSDNNTLNIAQQITPFAKTTVTERRFYRVSLSYQSLPGEVAATEALKAEIAVLDANKPGGNYQIALRSLEDKSVATGILRGEAGKAAIGVDSNGWRRVSATFELDPDILGGSAKSIAGMTLFIYSTGYFSGQLGLDRIVLEQVDADGTVVSALPVVNGSFDEGHRQFAVGDWAATFTSRLNGAAFWGSTTHNGGGTAIFMSLTDALANFMRGDELAKAVWQNESNSGGALYGDPLYSPLAVALRLGVGAGSSAAAGIPLRADLRNGSDSEHIELSYAVDWCYSTDFYVCDRTSAWRATGIAGSALRGRDVALGTFDTSGIEANRPFILRLKVTTHNKATGRTQTFNDFSVPIMASARTGSPRP